MHAKALFLFAWACMLTVSAHAAARSPAIDTAAKRAMAATGAQGIAIALIEDGRVAAVGAYGLRNASGEPLGTDTIMYGASLTKAVFAYTVMQLVEEGRFSLDQTIAEMLPRPLTDYDETDNHFVDYRTLRGDERWRRLTPRILLTHSSGFANFGFFEPDGKLKFHFEPGSRYAYSGEGLILLQFAMERGLSIDVGAEIQRRVFDRFGMIRTSLMWRPDFAADLADGWTKDGGIVPHDERSRVRVAGSMDTTISDFAKFAAAYIRGAGLSAASMQELTRPQLPITTASQFPTLQPELPPDRRHAGLAAALGVVAFTGPQGPGFYKGGHDDATGNSWVCVKEGARCVVILSNDVRAEAAFPQIVRDLIGESGVPWQWEYGPQPWAK